MNNNQRRPTFSVLSHIFLLLLLCIHPRPAAAQGGLLSFLKCLPSTTLVHQPPSPGFTDVLTRSYRHNRATPRAIVLVRSENEVARVVQCASDANMGVCARSGGHSYTSASLCSGIVIDLGTLSSVTLSKGSAVASVQAGAVLGDVLWKIWSDGRRWFSSGVCPGVGVGGYFLGGGVGPYMHRLGIACDALTSVRLVNRHGKVVVASRWMNRNLFWALCGSGGGQFGIVLRYNFRTVSSKDYDDAVVFRFSWPLSKAGELVNKWQGYGQHSGEVWTRVEVSLAGSGEGITIHGACFNAISTRICADRLEKAKFYHVEGRRTEILSVSKSAPQIHGFFSGAGQWGRVTVSNGRAALVGKRYMDRGKANVYTYRSAFLTLRHKNRNAPSSWFWQRWANFCANPSGRRSFIWTTCQLNLMRGAAKRRQANSAFAHRGADVLSSYMLGGGAEHERRFAYFRMKTLQRNYVSGAYVNYPELELGKSQYPALYWGKSLGRLRRMKKIHDPKLFFQNPQPIR